jgi:hypothetical protein
MELSDRRHSDEVVGFDDLDQAERDEYTRLRLYMVMPRTCSQCRKHFCLADSIGVVSRCSKRDHVDFDTEPIGDLMSFSMSFRLMSVLKSVGVWPVSNETARNTEKCYNKSGVVSMMTVNRIQSTTGRDATARAVCV